MRLRFAMMAGAGATCLAGALWACGSSGGQAGTKSPPEGDSGAGIDTGAVIDNPPVPASEDSGPEAAPGLSDAGIDADADADIVWTGGGTVCEAGGDCQLALLPWCVRGYCVNRLCSDAPNTSACTSGGGTCRTEATPFDGGPDSYSVCEYPH